MAALASVQWLYILIVLVSLAAGIFGIRGMVGLARSARTAYRDALLVLFVGALSSGMQTFVSQALRGASAPQNIRFYVTLFVLVVFLLLRLPPLWQWCGFDRAAAGGGSGMASLGSAMTAFGGIVLSTPWWTGTSHIGADGANWVSLYAAPLAWTGGFLLAGGVVLLILVVVRRAVRAPGALVRVKTRTGAWIARC
jgi:hypothetical protein